MTAGKYFEHCTGVEPSDTYKNEVFKQGGNIQVVHGCFDKNIRLEWDYDAFASFQVFEHLGDPLGALQLLYNVCRENAYGIINVPNGLQVFCIGTLASGNSSAHQLLHSDEPLHLGAACRLYR